MIVSVDKLLNNVRDANAELLYEGYQNFDDRMETEDNLYRPIIKEEAKVDHEDVDEVDADDFKDTNELCFVPENSLLFSALMSFYNDKSERDFVKTVLSHRYISCFMPQFHSKDSRDERGFWFIDFGNNGYFNSLVPSKLQDAFKRSLNPSLSKQVSDDIPSAEREALSEIIDDGLEANKEQGYTPEAEKQYRKLMADAKSAAGKLGL